ncbi:MAG TPA: hypothetical protein VFE93_04550, partial [Myxococcaceae bacterium]|nr:hypothetical protein [Myxococcaceae bacterium]
MPTLPESRAEAAQRHRDERAHAESMAADLDRRMARVANGRVVAFLATAVAVLLTVFHRLPRGHARPRVH